MTYSDDVIRLNPELAKMAESKPASKYHNARTEVKGLRFDSGKEAAEVSKLIMLEERKQIFALRLQVRFPLPGGIVYVADAVYLDEKLEPVILDVKGVRTREYKLKRKLFKETYGKDILEI